MEREPANEAERLRVEAIAAFAHEIRTPITSLKMLVELARRHGEDGAGVLDAELMELLRLTVDEITRLVDDAQEASRFMRGKIRVDTSECSLREIIADAQASMPEGVDFDGIELPEGQDVVGEWDGKRLARTVAQLATAVDRLGAGNGAVRGSLTVADGEVAIRFVSGAAGAALEAMAADAGLGFFLARQFILGIGGIIEYERAAGYAKAGFRVSYVRENP